MPNGRRWLRFIVAAALAGCAPLRTRTSAVDACRPVPSALPAGTSTAGLGGEYEVTMVATAGVHAGRTVLGRLALTPQDSALLEVEGAAQPFRGTADIALDSVGAVQMGDLAAADPSAPGVAVYEQRSPGVGPTVIVRLGSASNARGPQPFDAGHTTLYVRRITDAGFAGGWGSSAGSTYPIRQAQGYFCAVRARS
jgi:hypothetical protein